MYSAWCLLCNQVAYISMSTQYTLIAETGQFPHKDPQHSNRKMLNDISYDNGRMTFPKTVNLPAPTFEV